ncbi:MAG: tail fiber domain-containing protein, partial [Luminiphilus sp.]|nr:tail fiber domain-containing protein [Luminiphilus sp.]
MIRLLMAGLLLVSVNTVADTTVADTQVTHSFKDGDIIEAEEFNKNFDDLETAIDTVLISTTEEAIALTSNGGGGISLKTNHGTNDIIVVTNLQGNSADSIKLDSISAGITLSAADDITLNPGVSGNGNVTVAGNLIASGSVTANSVVNSSDARLKEAVSSVGVGLGLINDLNPVRYHRINNPESDIEMGLMAQEVEATLAKHGLGNSGMVVQPDDKGYLYLRYNDLLAPMIKAIQELDDASEAKDEQIASLQQKLESQQEELLAIVQSQQEQIAQL